jgi:hypothetical protein
MVLENTNLREQLADLKEKQREKRNLKNPYSGGSPTKPPSKKQKSGAAPLNLSSAFEEEAPEQDQEAAAKQAARPGSTAQPAVALEEVAGQAAAKQVAAFKDMMHKNANAEIPLQQMTVKGDEQNRGAQQLLAQQHAAQHNVLQQLPQQAMMSPLTVQQGMMSPQGAQGAIHFPAGHTSLPAKWFRSPPTALSTIAASAACAASAANATASP